VPLTAKPLLAQFPDRMMIEYPKAWPTQAAALYASAGYELEKDGQPVFLANFEDLRLRDRIAPKADGRGVTRTIEFSGRLPEWQTWLLLGEADRIDSKSSQRWSAAPRGWTIELPEKSVHRPTVRSEGNRQLLAVRLDRAALREPLTYSITW
jgi:hypothetical protein